MIASNATPDKNHLSTGTLSFNDLKNEADYSAKSIGATYHKYGNYKNMTEDEQNKVYSTIGLALNISIPPPQRTMQTAQRSLPFPQESSTPEIIQRRTSLLLIVILQTRSMSSVNLRQGENRGTAGTCRSLR